MAKNKNTSEKRVKKQKLAEDSSEAPVSKKKKKIAEVSGESATENSKVEPEDPKETEDLTPEERRVLERKLKKERKKEEKRLKRENASLAEKTEEKPANSTAGEQALQYLKRWSQKHPEWKFQKIRQTWLLMNMYDPEKVPDKDFQSLLTYMEGLKGNAREITIQKAEEYMKEHDSRETQEEPDEQKLGRIREVLQLLS